jgi:para-nitrobenzyl esterase
VTACLRKAWAPALVAAQRFYVGRPKVGGGILPVAPQAAIESGQFNRVPVITGTTRSEFRLLSTSMAGITAEGYRTYVETTYGTRAPAVLDLYPLERFVSPYDAVTQLQTDASFACQTERPRRRWRRPCRRTATSSTTRPRQRSTGSDRPASR